MLSFIDNLVAFEGVLGDQGTAILLAVGGAAVALLALLAIGFFRRKARAARRPPAWSGDRASTYVNARRPPVATAPAPQVREAAAPEAAQPVGETARPGAAEPPFARPAAAPIAPAAPAAPPASSADRTAAGLRRALQDPDPFIRIAIIAGLIGQEGAEDIILEALVDEYPQVRREAVRALAEIGGSAAVRALSDVVQGDPSAEVREEAVAALATLIERRTAGERPPEG